MAEAPLVTGGAPALAPAGGPVLTVRSLSVSYPSRGSRALAVNRVDLQLRRGEVLGLVGESGSGKTTMATAVLGLLRPPARVEGGQVVFGGEDLLKLSREALRRLRWQGIGFVPQGAMSALNPVLRVGGQFADALRSHGVRDRADIRRRTADLLRSVDLEPRTARMYPHQLSGGMKQRVCIAMAIALEPTVVVADEPTSALDVVVQRSVMRALKAVQRDRGLSVLLIGHDMALHAQVADRLAVMCKGHLVEVGAVAEVFGKPAHPCTRLLLSSVPSLRERGWVPAAASAQRRDEADRLAMAGHPLRPVGADHEAALP